MKPCMVCFSGRIGSGKSSLSKGVAKYLGWPVVSFGDYVRSVAIKRELGGAREVLQEVGNSLIAEGWTKFCLSVLGQVDWKPGRAIIVDGIRHIEGLETLKTIVHPMSVYLVYLETGDIERARRMGNDKMKQGASMDEIDKHSTELQVNMLLPKIANVIVNGERTIEELISHVVVILEQKQNR